MNCLKYKAYRLEKNKSCVIVILNKITSKSEQALSFFSSTAASRDYTFVSDVVNGVLLAMNRQPAKCGEIYNIGSGAEPVSMETVFSLLKEELGKSVKQVRTHPL